MKRDCMEQEIRWPALQNLLRLREQISRGRFISLAPSVTAAIFCSYLPRFLVCQTQHARKQVLLLSAISCLQGKKNLSSLHVLPCLGALGIFSPWLLTRKVLLKQTPSVILIFCNFLLSIASRSPGHQVLFLAYFSLCNSMEEFSMLLPHEGLR